MLGTNSCPFGGIWGSLHLALSTPHTCTPLPYRQLHSFHSLPGPERGHFDFYLSPRLKDMQVPRALRREPSLPAGKQSCPAPHPLPTAILTPNHPFCPLRVLWPVGILSSLDPYFARRFRPPVTIHSSLISPHGRSVICPAQTWLQRPIFS